MAYAYGTGRKEAIHDPKERILKLGLLTPEAAAEAGSNPRSERADIETGSYYGAFGVDSGSNPRSERADIETSTRNMHSASGL